VPFYSKNRREKKKKKGKKGNNYGIPHWLILQPRDVLLIRSMSMGLMVRIPKPINFVFVALVN
jgi:hypothetical protein